MQPWTGDSIFLAMKHYAKKNKIKRPAYILGISDSSIANRQLMGIGADGFIKVGMLHGWDQWPKKWPEPLDALKRTRFMDTPEYFKMKDENKKAFLAWLKELDESGELDEYRDPVYGSTDLITE